MPRYVRRFSKAPWLYDQRDVEPQGPPDSMVVLPSGALLLGLHIRGFEDALILGIRADAAGNPLRCAIANEEPFSVTPAPPRPYQPGPYVDGA